MLYSSPENSSFYSLSLDTRIYTGHQARPDPRASSVTPARTTPARTIPARRPRWVNRLGALTLALVVVGGAVAMTRSLFHADPHQPMLQPQVVSHFGRMRAVQTQGNQESPIVIPFDPVEANNALLTAVVEIMLQALPRQVAGSQLPGGTGALPDGFFGRGSPIGADPAPVRYMASNLSSTLDIASSD